MRILRHALDEVARLGKTGVRAQQQSHGHRLERRRFGSLSLGSTADRRKTAGVDARRPTHTMELRRAEEVQKCADKGWKSALICLGNMRKGGVSPGSPAYNVALKACTEAEEWDRAAALLADMQGTPGADPDASIVMEIERALAEAGQGGLLDDLSCDSAAVSGSAAGPGSKSGGGSSSVKSKSGDGLGGGSGGRSRGSSAGIHTMVALGPDDSWPSRRYSNDNNNKNSNPSSSSSSSGMTSSMSSTTTIMSRNSSGGSPGSMAADVHAILALGADSPWPSRRPSYANDHENNNSADSKHGSNSGVAQSRSSSGVSWGGWRWHNIHQHTTQQHQEREKDSASSHASASFYGGRRYARAGERSEKGAAWPSSPTAPFAGSWGDD